MYSGNLAKIASMIASGEVLDVYESRFVSLGRFAGVVVAL